MDSIRKRGNMDPNANIEEQLEIAQWFLFLTAEQLEMKKELIPGYHARLCELVIALDKWIIGGGFLPGRWKG